MHPWVTICENTYLARACNINSSLQYNQDIHLGYVWKESLHPEKLHGIKGQTKTTDSKAAAWPKT